MEEYCGSAKCGKSTCNCNLDLVGKSDDRLKKLKEIACNGKGFYRLAKLTVGDLEACRLERKVACNRICACMKTL